MDDDGYCLDTSDATARTKVIRCCHPSHQSGRGGKQEASMFPTFTVRSSLRENSWDIQSMRRSCKVALFDVDPGRPIAFDDLKDHLRKLEETQSKEPKPENFIQLCPHVKFNSYRLLCPFQPGRCACFGIISLPWMKCEGTRVLYPKPLDSGPGSGGNCLHRALADPSMEGQFLSKQPCRANGGGVPVKHEVYCDSCQTSYSWSREKNRVFLTIDSQVPGWILPSTTTRCPKIKQSVIVKQIRHLSSNIAPSTSRLDTTLFHEALHRRVGRKIGSSNA